MAIVSIKECKSYDTKKIYSLVKEALEDVKFKIKKGSKVLLKPNLLMPCKPKQAVTTHPAIVDAVCRILKEKKCKIIIGDSSGFFTKGYTRKVFEVSGLKKIADKYKAEFVAFEESEKIKIKDKEGVMLKEMIIGKIVKDVDLFISLPKLKTHRFTKYTGAIKNVYGCVPGGLKQRYHLVANSEKKFANLILDIYKNVTPDLSIMDAIVGLEGSGPGPTGNPKQTGLLLVSEDAASLDVIAQRIIGFNPSEITYMAEGVKRGIFDDKGIKVIGKVRKVLYKKPGASKIVTIMMFFAGLRFRSVLMYPCANKELCKKCGICKKVCPAKAITMEPYPKINKKKCINCYCCHELCPYAAMELKKPRLLRTWHFIKKIIKRK